MQADTGQPDVAAASTGDRSVSAAPRAAWRRPPGPGRVIGVPTPGYGMERVSYMIPSARRRYVKLPRVPVHRLERRGTFWAETPALLGANVDLVHSFNSLPVNRPFAVTVEMELPRYLGRAVGWQHRLGLDLLRSDRCRGIWPLSEAAAAYCRRRFEAAGRPELSEKITVFRGAVAPPPAPDPDGHDPAAGPLRLLFVGGDGLRKGLGPTVDAAAAVRAAGAEVTLTVVGAPTADNYLVPGRRYDTTALARRLAEEPWITHHASLPNIAVRRMMGEHHLLAFPTADESLGWVPAEAAMSGTPTISTDVFALPEIVLGGETGWLLPVPLDADRRWAGLGTPDAAARWDALQTDLTGQLTAALGEAAANRAEVARRGAAARRHVAAFYGMDTAGAALDILYERAITR